jgi:hypothetical protein
MLKSEFSFVCHKQRKFNIKGFLFVTYTKRSYNSISHHNIVTCQIFIWTVGEKGSRQLLYTFTYELIRLFKKEIEWMTLYKTLHFTTIRIQKIFI